MVTSRNSEATSVVMQQQFDNRRAEMEMRMQEAQLERELRWMEENLVRCLRVGVFKVALHL